MGRTFKHERVWGRKTPIKATKPKKQREHRPHPNDKHQPDENDQYDEMEMEAYEEEYRLRKKG